MKLSKIVFIAFNCLMLNYINANNVIQISKLDRIDLMNRNNNSFETQTKNQYCAPINSNTTSNNNAFELKVHENDNQFNIENAINYKNSAIQAMLKIGYHGISAKLDNKELPIFTNTNEFTNKSNKLKNTLGDKIVNNYINFINSIKQNNFNPEAIEFLNLLKNNNIDSVAEKSLFFKHGLYANMQLNYKIAPNATFGPFIEYEALYLDKANVSKVIDAIILSAIDEIFIQEKLDVKIDFEKFKQNIQSFVDQKNQQLNSLNNIFSHNISAGLAFGLNMKIENILNLYTQLGIAGVTNIHYNSLIKAVNNKPLFFIEAGANINLKDNIEFSVGARYDIGYNIETHIATNKLTSNKFQYIDDKYQNNSIVALKDVYSYRIFGGIAINF